MKSEHKEISDELFLKLGKAITDKYGIKLPPEKKIMFQARLQRRLIELDIHSFEEYVAKLFGNDGESTELNTLIDYISTNKTEFFRENDHFLFLANTVLPEFINPNTQFNCPMLNIWSAGCSNGQEAFSIAITIEEFLRTQKKKNDYSILATDVSGRMLRMAKEAIYPMSHIAQIGVDIKYRYFLKSKVVSDFKVRVSKEVRDKVKIARLNLMDETYAFNQKFDIVFLRNTLIYFDSPTQRRVLSKVLDNLITGGYLFIGHSESLINLNLPIKSVAPSVYVKTDG